MNFGEVEEESYQEGAEFLVVEVSELPHNTKGSHCALHSVEIPLFGEELSGFLSAVQGLI